MQLLQIVSSSVVIGAALLPSARFETEIAFAPEEGLVLEKRATFSAPLELTDATFEANGEVVEGDVPEITQTTEGELLFTDRYATLADGRCTRLERTFDELEQRSSVEGTPEGRGDKDETLESPLAGATVVFAWDPEEEEYAASYAEGSADAYDEELLEELDWDMDYAGLLPDGPVEEGAEWTVDAETMGVVMSLGGELQFEQEEENLQGRLVDEAMEEGLEGDATLSFAGMRDHEGTEVAAIHVAWEAEGSASGDDSQELGDGAATLEREAEASSELTLEGDLLWDVEAGHFVLLELKGTLSITVAETLKIEGPDGGAAEQRSSVTFAGPISVRVAAEAP